MILDQLNRPIRDLRISVTDKCNFRCPYCMPIDVYGDDYEFSPKQEILTFEEIIRLSTQFVKAGVNKIRITGGEPLIRKNLDDLIRELNKIEGLDDITLTTNGWFLSDWATRLKEAGLKRITVSLDSLDKEVFGVLNGRGYEPERVLDGIKAAQAAGLDPIKVNAVVKRSSNYESIVPLAEYFRGTGVIIRYIEYMDVGTRNNWKLDEVVPSREVIDLISKRWPMEPMEPNYTGEVASRYRFEDGAGEVGVISSITQPFCGSCTRARLTTDGHLVTCLFAPGGQSLRDLLREGADDERIYQTIVDHWSARDDRYSEERTANTPMTSRKRIEMYQIGG